MPPTLPPSSPPQQLPNGYVTVDKDVTVIHPFKFPKPCPSKNGSCRTCGKPTRSHWHSVNWTFQCHDCYLTEHEPAWIKEARKT